MIGLVKQCSTSSCSPKHAHYKTQDKSRYPSPPRPTVHTPRYRTTIRRRNKRRRMIVCFPTAAWMLFQGYSNTFLVRHTLPLRRGAVVLHSTPAVLSRLRHLVTTPKRPCAAGALYDTCSSMLHSVSTTKNETHASYSYDWSVLLRYTTGTPRKHCRMTRPLLPKPAPTHHRLATLPFLAAAVTPPKHPTTISRSTCKIEQGRRESVNIKSSRKTQAQTKHEKKKKRKIHRERCLVLLWCSLSPCRQAQETGWCVWSVYGPDIAPFGNRSGAYKTVMPSLARKKADLAVPAILKRTKHAGEL